MTTGCRNKAGQFAKCRGGRGGATANMPEAERTFWAKWAAAAPHIEVLGLTTYGQKGYEIQARGPEGTFAIWQSPNVPKHDAEWVLARYKADEHGLRRDYGVAVSKAERFGRRPIGRGGARALKTVQPGEWNVYAGGILKNAEAPFSSGTLSPYNGELASVDIRPPGVLGSPWMVQLRVNLGRGWGQQKFASARNRAAAERLAAQWTRKYLET